jgi:hypothetical protein
MALSVSGGQTVAEINAMNVNEYAQFRHTIGLNGTREGILNG